MTDVLSVAHWKHRVRPRTNVYQLLNILNVFRYLDGALTVQRPLVQTHIQILETYTERYYTEQLQSPADRLTFYAILEYFLRSSTVYFLDREKIINGPEAIETLCSKAVYLVHMLRGKISYYDILCRKWSTEESEYIKQTYFADGALAIEDLTFQPLVYPEEDRTYWGFIVPKITEKDKNEENAYIYGFYSGPEKTVTNVLTDAQGEVHLKANLATDLITHVQEEEKQEISLKLLTNTNKSGKACKSFNSEIREGISQSALREALRSILNIYDLYTNPDFLIWSASVKLHKKTARVCLTDPESFDAWYSSLEKTIDFFEMTLRILDYYQYGDRHWFFNKYTYHYYFKRNPVSLGKKRDKIEEESLFEE
jgi:hypothetical protein